MLLHAVGTDLTLWGPQIEALQPDYDVVAVDLPGHGLSTQPAGEPSFTMFAAGVRQLLERLAAGPVHLVGISFGGMVAQTVALERPALVRSLSLIGTACTFPEIGRAARRERAQFVREKGMPALAPPSRRSRWRAGLAPGSASAGPMCWTGSPRCCTSRSPRSMPPCGT